VFQLRLTELKLLCAIDRSMQKPARLQLAGPLALFAALAVAETAAYALAQYPASAFLWYLNLDVFGLFRKSRLLMGEWGAIPFAQLALAAPLALVATAALVRRGRFLTALASTLGFVYAVFLGYAWERWNFPLQASQASLVPIAFPTGNDLCLFLTLGSAALVSFIATQLVYFRAVRSG
jgi:hypothetical protein